VYARRLWGRVDPGAVLASYDGAVAASLETVVTAGQLAAADGAQQYVAAALDLQGADPDPVGTVDRRAFAGVASDGRDLASLLRIPAQDTVGLLAAGRVAEEALAAGLAQLERIVLTQVADASRVATGVAMANDRRVTGYVRVLTPPSCSRCVILAGQWYRWNKGFQRHPRCDCYHAPSSEVIKPQSPKAIFDSMDAGQLKKAGWSDADVRAIRDGADMFQVTNARRDLRSVTVAGRQVQTTGVGTTRRALAGSRLRAAGKRKAVRLTPESIYDIAGHDRDEALRLLRLHGYIF
jgi:hypothetical protein